MMEHFQLLGRYLLSVFSRMHIFLPHGNKFYVVGLAALVWAIWTS